ncbi:MAG: DUF86 domain-containing protein [Acidimicrobiaceae bacterium]|nr:DUF86 domain-containing protein [Acidimicrobiaceae bacterium]
MSRSDDERVQDILGASRKLAEIVAMGRKAFDDSWLVFSAAERQLEIIGTAAGALSTQFAQSTPELPIQDAKDMRNLISHQYHRSDPDIVWQTISKDVPDFAKMLQTTVYGARTPI